MFGAQRAALRSARGDVHRRSGWPTGGSGVLVPAVVGRAASPAAIDTWQRSMGGGDLVLACAAHDLGLRTQHMPTRFLDACLYCMDFNTPRQIFSCHAASAFRGFNRYAIAKRRADNRKVHGAFTFRCSRSYQWPKSLDYLAPELRMRAVQTTLCPPGLSMDAALGSTRGSTSCTDSGGGKSPSGARAGMGVLAPNTSRCDITTWSSDGFGHQLAAALSCKLLALTHPRAYRYVPSRHTELEHGPAGADALFDLLDTLFLDVGGGAPPAQVPPGRYHPNCDGGWRPRKLPACAPNASALTVCDNCYRMFGQWGEPAVAAAAKLVVHELRRRVAAFMWAGDGSVDGARASCPRRPDVCVHMRGMGSPGTSARRQHAAGAPEGASESSRRANHTTTAAASSSGDGAILTTAKAEMQAMHRRSYPQAWWHDAVEAALRERHGVDDPSPPTVGTVRTVLVHTNNDHLANQTFGPWPSGSSSSARADAAPELLRAAWRGRGADVRFMLAGAHTPVLGMLHELIFCCRTLVVSTSALSSVAALATHASATYAHAKADMHFGFPYKNVIRP